MKIRIFGLDKAIVLLNLYNNAKQQGSVFDNMPAARLIGSKFKPGTYSMAVEKLNAAEASRNFNFEYLDLGSGPRVLKVDLENEVVDFTQYDYFHGKGLALEVIHQLDLAQLDASKPKPTYYFWGEITEFYRCEHDQYSRLRELLVKKKQSRVVEETHKIVDYGMVTGKGLFRSKF